MVRILRGEGYDVSAVTNGDEAIAAIQASAFDVILLDFMMPVISGQDVLAWLRANQPDVQKGCVIIVTAAVSELRRFDRSTVAGTLVKPFDIHELRAVVRACVERRRA